MAKQVTFSAAESLERLKRSLDSIAPQIEIQINSAIGELAQAAYASIVAQAQNDLQGTRADYLKGLKYEQLGENEYLITLDGDFANAIEEGWASYDMVPALLKSQANVSAGTRAGQPWVQMTKPTKKEPAHKFAHVPLERHPHSKAPGQGDLASTLRAMTAVNLQGQQQKITQVFKDPLGNPVQGKAAIGQSDNPLVNNLVKYQKTYSAGGKDTTQSVYFNFRTISETGKPWVNKGYAGLHSFEKAEKELDKQIDQILKVLLGD